MSAHDGAGCADLRDRWGCAGRGAVAVDSIPLARGSVDVKPRLLSDRNSAAHRWRCRPAMRGPRTSPAAAAHACATAVPPPATTRPASVTASVAPVIRSLRPTGRPDGLEQRVRATATRQTPARVAQPGSSRPALRHSGAGGRPVGADHGAHLGLRHRRARAPAVGRRHRADFGGDDQLRHGAGAADLGA
jgi:hypothetical protein